MLLKPEWNSKNSKLSLARLEICEDPCEIYVEIAEGKYHQVKRMFERVGKAVIYLKRVAVGGLELPETSSIPGDIF